MLFERSAVVLFVNDIIASCDFYKDLLGINPEVPSPSFKLFKLPNGMEIGLKDKHTMKPYNEGTGGCELAFTVTTKDMIDKTFLAWQQKGINIIQPPEEVSFGYSLTALDPDGNQLRVVSLKHVEGNS